MLGKDLDSRRKVVKTRLSVGIYDPLGGLVNLTCEVQIVTFGYSRSLVTWFAEGLGDSMVWIGDLDSDVLVRAICQDVRSAYAADCEV